MEDSPYRVYTEALEFLRRRMRSEAFEDYVSFFLPRAALSERANLEFLSFFRFSLEKYLRLKHNWFLSLPEGDMVSELILDTYRTFISDLSSSAIAVTDEGRANLLSALTIVFPCRFDSEEVAL